MNTLAAGRMATSPEKAGHRRNKSASVLKQIIPSRGHKKTPSDGAVLIPDAKHDKGTPTLHAPSQVTMPLLPADHPHAKASPYVSPNYQDTRQQRVLSEISTPNETTQPTNHARDGKPNRPKELHRRNLSTISLRSLGKEKEKGEGSNSSKESDTKKKTKKEKSSSNLAAMFGKSKSSKSGREAITKTKDKENTTPPHTAQNPTEHTPIWSQLRTADLYEERTTTKSIPLNDHQSIKDEIALYTPQNYSPSKQRNFYGLDQPKLQQKRPTLEQRPRSDFLPASGSAVSLIENITRKMSGERERPENSKMPPNKSHLREPISLGRNLLRRTSSERRTVSEVKPKPAPAVNTRGRRVMAVVAAINGKSKPEPTTVELDPEQIAAEFEAVLDSRNIPEELRPKMRALADTVKADFIKKNKVDSPQDEQPKPESKFAAVAETLTKRRAISDKTVSGSKPDGKKSTADPDSAHPSKRSRTRSRTFTFSKGDSPKKQKTEEWSYKSRKSVDLPKSPSSVSVNSIASSKNGSVGKTARAAAPDEFVNYLQLTPKPQEVEVGKLHKLRLLLRNETVAWVDTFIEKGGMKEITALLHRIIEIEWRYV
jgi:hypothetical protein